MARMTEQRRVGRGQIIAGVVMLLAGPVLAAVGIVGLIYAGAHFVTSYSAPEMTPVTLTQSLDGGSTYAVFQLADGSTAQISADDVKVTGPTGTVPVVPVGSDQTYTTGDSLFSAVVDFEPPQSGTYEVAVDAPNATVVVGPSLGSVGRFAVWIGAIVLGGLLFLAGIVLLIVGLVRRSSSRRTPSLPLSGGPGGPVVVPTAPPAPTQTAPPAAPQTAPPAAPQTPPPPAAPTAPPLAAQTAPPGWYPDPTRPGSRRYWDGAAWTEHQA